MASKKEYLSIVGGTCLLIALGSIVGSSTHQPPPEAWRAMATSSKVEQPKSLSPIEEKAVALSQEYHERNREGNEKTYLQRKIEDKIEQDQVMDSILGFYEPKNIFANYDDIQPKENISIKVNVYEYEIDHEKAVEIIDKTMPKYSFCYFVSDVNGEIVTNNSFIRGYVFLHWGGDYKPLAHITHTMDPNHDALNWRDYKSNEKENELYGIES